MTFLHHDFLAVADMCHRHGLALPSHLSRLVHSNFSWLTTMSPIALPAMRGCVTSLRSGAPLPRVRAFNQGKKKKKFGDLIVTFIYTLSLTQSQAQLLLAPR